MDIPEVYHELAKMLRGARVSGKPCAQPSQTYEEMDVGAAYAIQRINIEHHVEQSALQNKFVKQVGYKIGLTSVAVQKWLGVNEPDFGCLLSDMVVEPGALVNTSQLLQPRAEAEVAFVLKDSLRGPGVTAWDVIRATDYILPAIEIIDSRIADWKITYEDTVADNASSGLFVIGNHPVSLMEIDLSLAGMALRKNGQVCSTGAGAACLGHPVNAVVWLANKLGQFGTSLSAGQVVLSGALGPVVDVHKGDWLDAQIAHLGSISVRFG